MSVPAIMHHRGEGSVQDYTQAVKWCQHAAEQGLPEAQYTPGSCTSPARESPRILSKRTSGTTSPLPDTPRRRDAIWLCGNVIVSYLS